MQNGTERDRVTFGSEGPLETVDLGGKRARPTDPPSARVEDVIFRAAVDPRRRTYLTVECPAVEASPYKTIVFVDGEQASYRDGGDYEPLISANPGTVTGDVVNYTTLLPPACTIGKNDVEITLRTFRSDYRPTADAAGREVAEAPSRRFLRAHTHLRALRDLPVPHRDEREHEIGQDRFSLQEESERFHRFQEWQSQKLKDLVGRSGEGPGFSLSIERYGNELRFVAEAVATGWFGRWVQVDEADALRCVIETIDHHVRAYFDDVRTLASGGHQSDWGGYYSALGEALYLVEPVIRPSYSDWFEDLLDDPFELTSIGGPFSLPPVSLSGGTLTRRTAWERALKANFDFARSRLSYIYNQVMFTYEGAWKAHEGLRIISSAFYEGRERSHQLLSEALGFAPFRGEEILVGPDGRELDLRHSLFRHDKNAEFTDDTVGIVMKGLAKSSTDARGDVVRREPYGACYRGLTLAGLPRENGYVGVYGELANVLPLWFFRTLGHPADKSINEEILRRALDNVHARSFFRYPGTDNQGNRCMLLEQAIDERNPALPGRVAYSADAESGAALRYAALHQHMLDHPEQYGSEEWQPFLGMARHAASYTRQMLCDGQFFATFDERRERILIDDLRITETYERLRADSPPEDARLMPHADESDFSDDELRALGVSRVGARLRHEHPFAFVDIDSLALSLRDGDTRLFASLISKNRGFSGIGRAHLMVGDQHQVTAVSTLGVLRAKKWILRGPTREELRQHGADAIVEGRAFALLGEVLPVCFQPGVGEIRRDNFNEDNPFSALPELAVTNLGDYLAIVNTTREEHGNSRTYDVTVSGSDTEVFDLVSGTDVPVPNDRFISIGPSRAMVLRVGPGEESGIGIRTSGAALRKGPRMRGVDSWWYALDSDALLERLERTPRTGWTVYESGVEARGLPAVPETFEAAPQRCSGFGSGDDARIQERGRPDAFSAAVTEALGDVGLDARTEHGDGFVGVMVREDMAAVSRYVAFGFEGGELIVRTRSLDSREDFGVGNPGQDAAGGRVHSPVRLGLGVPQNDRLRLRLTRDASCHRFHASVALGEGPWSEVWSDVVPMLDLVHAGAVVASGGRVLDLRVRPI